MVVHDTIFVLYLIPALEQVFIFMLSIMSIINYIIKEEAPYRRPILCNSEYK